MNCGLGAKHALVGGASKGLGLAAAQALAAEGCAVTMVSRSAANLKAARNLLPQSSDVHCVAADLTTRAGLDACAREVAHGGPVDILVNNTGGPPPGGSFAHTDDEWVQAGEALLLYVKRACELFVPGMRERGWGRVITITSRTVKEPAPHLVLSNVYRSGVTAYLKILAKEVAADGVTVNTVLPGAFRTERYEQLLRSAAERTGRTTEEIAREVEEENPQKRFQRPEELGALIAFLASEPASGINGIAIPVDGGGLMGLLS